jgi:NADH-quinone oxidoreductase subunit K
MVDPFHLNILSILVFVIAVIGIILNLNHLIKVFLCIELMFLAVSINFVTYAYSLNNIDGQIFTVFLLTVAAAESAVGLGILVFYFRQRSTISVDSDNLLKE